MEDPRQHKTAPPHGQPRKPLQENSTALLCCGLLQVDMNPGKELILCTHNFDSCL